MQRYCTELTERLLKSLDKEYNVVDMGAVVDVITALEKTTITKEVLEVTRLGKYINELRRKTSNDALAKRAKDLVRRWRDMVLPSAHTQPQPTPADTAPQALNGTKPQSPALRGLKPQSPASFRSLKPQSPALKAPLKPHSPLMRDSLPLKVLSPALSLHSDQSRSPSLPTSRQHHHLHQQPSLAQTAPPPTSGNNHSNSPLTPKLGPITAQNHTIEAVPRTHSSNKRLRKENTSLENSPLTSPAPSSLSSHNKLQDSLVGRTEPMTKRQRLNGENPLNFSTTETSTSSRNNNDVSRLSAPNCCATTGSSTTDQQVPSPETERTNDRVPEVAYHDDTSETVLASDSTQMTLPEPKKRGRKKGSKSVKSQAFPEDRVKEKLASISRNPKLKTTQELLADLQARGSTAASGHFGTGTPTTVAPPRATEPPSTEEILRNAANDERPLSSRFLRMKREKLNLDDGTKKNRSKASGKHWGNSRKSEKEDEEEDEEDGSRVEQDDVRRSRVLSVEEILAKLPPLDRDAISWSDSEDKDSIDVMRTPERREICDSDVERLHGDCVEGLNGNFEAKVLVSRETRTEEESANEVRIEDIRIEESNEEAKRKSVYRRSGEKDKDRNFREWHEMLARPSYDGQILHILPYVIID